MSYSLDFVSLGCNKVASCADWGKDNIVAYGGGSFVGLYDVERGCLLATLPGHTGRVNSVKWVTDKGFHKSSNKWNELEPLVSGSSDESVILWTKTPNLKQVES